MECTLHARHVLRQKLGIHNQRANAFVIKFLKKAEYVLGLFSWPQSAVASLLFAAHNKHMLETLFPNGVEHYIIGGMLVGVGIASVYVLTGRVAGASTIFTSSWSYILSGSFFKEFTGTRNWRIVLALGMVLGGLVYYYFIAGSTATITELHPLRLFIGGVLVGIGTRMAGGCASGHGICGNAFFERDSIIATVTFLIVGILVATVTSQFI